MSLSDARDCQRQPAMQPEESDGEIGRLHRDIEILRAQLAASVARIDLIQHIERQRIARDLHDGLGQLFTSLHLEISALSRRSHSDADLKPALAHIASSVAAAGLELDQIIWALRPPQLDGGLASAIPALLLGWADRTGITFDGHVAIHGITLSSAMETTLFRILQEALLNVVKHASASKAGVVVHADSYGIRMTIEDNGDGFKQADEMEASIDDAPGLGLLGIRERLSLVGGTLEVETGAGIGTTLLIYVPNRD